jgi:hypothetical protein
MSIRQRVVLLLHLIQPDMRRAIIRLRSCTSLVHICFLRYANLKCAEDVLQGRVLCSEVIVSLKFVTHNLKKLVSPWKL